MKLFAALTTGYLFFSKFYTGAQSTEVVLSGCGNQISFEKETDVGSYTVRPASTCVTESGALMDMCTGETKHQFQPGLFKVVPNKNRQEIISKGQTLTIKAGTQSDGFGDSDCGGIFILKRDISFTPAKDIKVRHLKFTGDGRLINLHDGSTVMNLEEGSDYEILWKRRNEL